jgi:hypothetical protein
MATMRNDARPIGPETDQQSPLSESHSRDVVNREDRASGARPPRRDGPADSGSDADFVPTMPGEEQTRNSER